MPEAEIAVKAARLLRVASMSPMRPPQPRVVPSGPRACQVNCWSLCENRLAGRRCVDCANCALLVGRISGPMLGRMARRRCVLNSGTSGASSGCSAKLRPCASIGLSGSTPPRRAGEPAAAPATGAVPGASSAMESGAWLRVLV